MNIFYHPKRKPNFLSFSNLLFPMFPCLSFFSSNIPVASLTVEKSPQTKRISRPTQLPPSVPPVSKSGPPPHHPTEVTKASPETLEPLSDNAAAPQYINQVEASPDILHGTLDAFDGPSSKESNHNDHAYQNGKDSPATPDEFSVR